MVQEAKVNINIASLFTGKKAFKEADTTLIKLTKSVKRLGLAAGVAFTARAAVNFAKSSVKASLLASAQQERLAKLLTVTTGASAQQIDILTQQANMLERLGVVSATSVAQVQSQLATFDLQILTISKLTPAILDYVTAEKGATASAAEFKSLTNGLAQALNGNFASLTKTGFVLDEVTKKTISTGTESERAAAIVKVLDSTYKNFNATLRDTPQGQFQLLANAAEKAKVIIGTGLVDAMKKAFGNGDIEDAADNIVRMADAGATLINWVGTAVGLFAKLVSLTDKITPGYRVEKAKADKLKKAPYDPQSGNLPDMSAASLELIKKSRKADILYRRNVIKLNKEALKLEKKKTAELKARAAIEKANRALDFAGTIFDLDKIQLYAALQGRITEDDRNRLNLKLLLLNAENQTGEALNKSAQEATLLSQKILMNNGLVMTYDGLIKNLAKAKNPFEGFDDYLQDLLNKLRDIQLAMNNINSMSRATPPINYGYTAANPSFTYDPFPPLSNKGNAPTDYGYTAANPSFVYGSGNPMFGTDIGTNNGSFNGFSGTPFGQAASSGSTTNVVNLNANWIANPQEVQDAVQNALQNANRAGNSTNYAGGIF
jgi:hypothetical protein